MTHFALAAIGRDRPGIVAAVTEVLHAHSVNIEDSQATILRGHFTMMLVVAVAGAADAERLRAELHAVRDRLGLEALTLSELDDVDVSDAPAPTHVLTLYGADHPGIVHAATAALAERGVDITDLTTQLADGRGDPPLYAVMMEIAPPAGLGEDELHAALARVADEQGVDLSLRALESEAL